MRKKNLNPDLAAFSDEKLAADLRMLWNEYKNREKELESRGYIIYACSYMDGGTRVEIDRVTKSVL